jgi:hypothetical protein
VLYSKIFFFYYKSLKKEQTLDEMKIKLNVASVFKGRLKDKVFILCTFFFCLSFNPAGESIGSNAVFN